MSLIEDAREKAERDENGESPETIPEDRPSGEGFRSFYSRLPLSPVWWVLLGSLGVFGMMFWIGTRFGPALLTVLGSILPSVQ
jgi:hypothetical protein